VEKMRAGLRHLCPIFNAHRMVQEYVNCYYLPCSKRFNTLCHEAFAGAKELAAWRHKLMTSWHDVSVQALAGMHGVEKNVGEKLDVEAKVRLGALSQDDVTVEAYYGRVDQNGDFAERKTVSLKFVDSADGLHTFRGQIPCKETGRLGYTVRITPSQERLENPLIMGLITWA
jgi:starch phosphorylase